jgi:hypothetical protein
MYSLKFAKKVPFIFHKIQVEDNMGLVPREGIFLALLPCSSFICACSRFVYGVPIVQGLAAICLSSLTCLLPTTAFNAKTVSSPVPLASELVLRYVDGSTVKVEQLVGEEDKQLHQLTLSRTATIRNRRY